MLMRGVGTISEGAGVRSSLLSSCLRGAAGLNHVELVDLRVIASALKHQIDQRSFLSVMHE